MKALSRYTLFTVTFFILNIVNGFALNKSVIGRCTGSENCKACSSCSSCKHCSNGGSCGVCVSKRKTKSLPVPSSSPKRSSQCQAITKKGTQCSRSGTSNGYCWQHVK